MRKAYILSLFGVSMVLILRQYYKNNQGLPTPNTLATPAYAFGALLLMSDFLEGIPVVFATALTFSLAFQAANQTQSKPTTSKKAGK